jgi:serine/threonine-protein kinase
MTLYGLVDGEFMGHALIHATKIGFGYLAVEPYFRRLWPHVLISWARLLQGRYRDPVVGRDILVGIAVGTGIAAGLGVMHRMAAQTGSDALSVLASSGASVTGMAGTHEALVGTLYALTDGLIVMIWMLTIMVILRVLIRRERPAILAVLLVGTAILAPEMLRSLGPDSMVGPSSLVVGVALTLILSGSLLFLILRYGFLAALAGYAMTDIVGGLPWTLDLGAWYASLTVPTALLLAALLCYAFIVSLGGQTLLRDPLEMPGKRR